MTQAEQLANRTMNSHLHGNRYPGRGLVIGRASGEDAWLMIYWIMGRSPNSQNRRFVADGTTLRTEPVDATRVANPHLIIYEAMLDLPGIYLVSNGDQTRTLYETLRAGGMFDDAMATREREPDAPNYTPRISAMLDLRQQPGVVTISLLKANPANSNLTDRLTYRPAMPPAGVGVGLTTYMSDGSPLPSFHGDLLLLPCQGSAAQVLERYWQALDPEYRVALAVKWIWPGQEPSEILIRNRFALDSANT